MSKGNVNKCKIEGGKAYLTLYKNNGKFYIAMDEDAYILNLLFRYKVLEYKNSYKCGFPDNVINKVLNTLEDKHISYRIY